MEKQKIDMWVMANQKYFEPDKMLMIKEKLATLTDDQFMLLTTLELKDPTVTLVLSILLGAFGIDRFWIGDIGFGVLKLFTCGGCGILTIIDWFTISKKAKEKNYMTLMNAIM